MNAPHSVQLPGPMTDFDVPFTQGVQAAEPVTSLNFPAAQDAHSVPSAPSNPAKQVQIRRLAFENVFAGHAAQVVAPANE